MHLLEKFWNLPAGTESDPWDRCAAQAVLETRATLTAPLEWSGKPTGTFGTGSLTDGQRHLLTTLTLRRRITDVSPSQLCAEELLQSTAYPHRTIQSVLQHAFVRRDTEGEYWITDHGLHALAVLKRKAMKQSRPAG